jgi:hypothetical protein
VIRSLRALTVQRKLLLASSLIFLALGSLVSYLYVGREVLSPENVGDIELAAKKVKALQSAELQASVKALEQNGGSKIIWGDRFLRWTVLAYTIWRLDRGDEAVVPEMQKLLALYYDHA